MRDSQLEGKKAHISAGESNKHTVNKRGEKEGEERRRKPLRVDIFERSSMVLMRL